MVVNSDGQRWPPTVNGGGQRWRTTGQPPRQLTVAARTWREGINPPAFSNPRPLGLSFNDSRATPRAS
ncbi:hypothetical protein Tco_0611662 [Tanacetum coccineum]